MSKKSKEEIGKALSASTIAYIDNGDIIQPAIAQEYDLAGDLRRVDDVINKIIRSSKILFSIETNKLSKRKHIVSTSLGKLFLNSLNADIYLIKRHYPLHRLNPYVELFIKILELRCPYELPQNIRALNHADVIKSVDNLNGCIDDIRKEANSSEFKKAIDEFKRLANKNYRELLRYINALFNRHARLLVIRLDVGYLKKHCWPCDVESSVTYDEVKQHWESFLKYLRTKLPSDCLAGFAYKLEYGLEKNFHFHILMMLDSSKVREDVTIGKLIGEYWAKTITNGKGLYYNCNAFKKNYKSCGIGVVNHDDIAMREGLEKAALYLTKTDYYIKMVAPENGRTFGKGNMPKPKTNLGRPRKKMKPASGES